MKRLKMLVSLGWVFQGFRMSESIRENYKVNGL